MTIQELLQQVQNPPELAATEFSGESERREYDKAGRLVNPWPAADRFSGLLKTVGGIRYRVDYERYFSEHDDDGLRERSFLIAEDGVSNLYLPRASGPPGKMEPDLCAIISPSGQGFGHVFFQPHRIGFAMHPRFFQPPHAVTVLDILVEYQEYEDFHTISNRGNKVVFETTLDEPEMPHYTLIFDPARNWLVESCRSTIQNEAGETTSDEEAHLSSTFEPSPGVWIPRETRGRALGEDGGYVEWRTILLEVKYNVAEPIFLPEIAPGISICDKR